jgi:hypothetical protein
MERRFLLQMLTLLIFYRHTTEILGFFSFVNKYVYNATFIFWYYVQRLWQCIELLRRLAEILDYNG